MGFNPVSATPERVLLRDSSLPSAKGASTRTWTSRKGGVRYPHLEDAVNELTAKEQSHLFHLECVEAMLCPLRVPSAVSTWLSIEHPFWRLGRREVCLGVPSSPAQIISLFQEPRGIQMAGEMLFLRLRLPARPAIPCYEQLAGEIIQTDTFPLCNSIFVSTYLVL